MTTCNKRNEITGILFPPQKAIRLLNIEREKNLIIKKQKREIQSLKEQVDFLKYSKLNLFNKLSK